jgi:hypothetical protein
MMLSIRTTGKLLWIVTINLLLFIFLTGCVYNNPIRTNETVNITPPIKNISQNEALHIALNDSEVQTTLQKYSYETIIAKGIVDNGKHELIDAYVIEFWLFQGNSRPYGLYNSELIVNVDLSGKIINSFYEPAPRYPAFVPIEKRFNLTNSSVYTHIQS